MNQMSSLNDSTLNVLPCTMPCVNKFGKGSSWARNFFECKNFVMNREYNKCNIACSMPPGNVAIHNKINEHLLFATSKKENVRDLESKLPIYTSTGIHLLVIVGSNAL